MRQARDGIRVREVKIPVPPEDSGQITDILISTIGPRTRVIRFSGITSPTGLLLPVHEICEAARSRRCGHGGQWGCSRPPAADFGIRKDNLERLWPHTVTANWDKKGMKAARFMMMRTNDRAMFYDRIHQLARTVYEKARELAARLNAHSDTQP